MSNCEQLVNPEWSFITAGLIASGEEAGIYLTYAQKNWLDMIVSVAVNRPYIYNIVSSPDTDNPAEQAAGNSITDARLFGGPVVFMIVHQKASSLQDILQTDNSDNQTTTISLTDGTQWAVGDKVAVFYR